MRLGGLVALGALLILSKPGHALTLDDRDADGSPISCDMPRIINIIEDDLTRIRHASTPFKMLAGSTTEKRETSSLQCFTYFFSTSFPNARDRVSYELVINDGRLTINLKVDDHQSKEDSPLPDPPSHPSDSQMEAASAGKLPSAHHVCDSDEARSGMARTMQKDNSLYQTQLIDVAGKYNADTKKYECIADIKSYTLSGLDYMSHFAPPDTQKRALYDHLLLGQEPNTSVLNGDDLIKAESIMEQPKMKAALEELKKYTVFSGFIHYSIELFQSGDDTYRFQATVDNISGK